MVGGEQTMNLSGGAAKANPLVNCTFCPEKDNHKIEYLQQAETLPCPIKNPTKVSLGHNGKEAALRVENWQFRRL